MKKISLVIPVFNEENGIPELAKRVSNVSDQMHYQIEIIVVNDGSTDDTKKLLNETNKQCCQLQEPNQQRLYIYIYIYIYIFDII